MGIDNTTRAVQGPGGVTALMVSAIAPGTDATIAAMEADGQRRLVASDLLPTDCDTAAFEAAGFTFGDVVDSDPLFRVAILPPGWTRHASDHAMWSHIRDQHGRHRAAVFYRADFYDRRAGMRLVDLEEYVHTCLRDATNLVTDDTWATPATVRQIALALAASLTHQAKKCRLDGKPDRAREHERTTRAAYNLAERLQSESETTL